MNFINPPLQKLKFKQFCFFLKRDDLLSEDFSGNKARKFHYFLNHDFEGIKKLVSYGSNQSNAMYSLSVLCALKSWDFEYYTKHISSFLRQNPNGNYENALRNNMKISTSQIPRKVIENLDNDTLFIKEGGAVKEAEYGLKILANELKEFILKNNLKNPKIFLPSGTGTSALYLQKNLSCQVFTCACAGDETYLKKQFKQLETNNSYFPKILNLEKKYHFGQLYKENIELYLELLKELNIEFDLLYDMQGLRIVFEYFKDEKELIYIHQGGLKGNISMLMRYKHKFIELFS